jgi:FtsP/CotA-like multicopper oxidase with cupredoxin domain
VRPGAHSGSQASLTTTIQATKRTLDIKGKSASVLGLLQPDGTQGIHSVVNQRFRVTLDNKLSVPTAIHWHGLHPPNKQDGVPGVTQPRIDPNTSAVYDFTIWPSGTHWMHSHQGLQEAFLLAAPLIVHDLADAQRDEQEIVLLLSDFSFTPPKEVFANLRQRSKGMGTNNETQPAMSAKAEMKMSSKPDANDVNYEAYLANDRTLRDPEVVKVERGGRLHLRIINGGSGTNFFIDLGSLTGELIATDGMPVRPIQGKRFPLAIAQRIDLRIQVPREGGVFPILALRELAREQTGIVLATPGARVQQLPEKGQTPAACSR